MNFRGMWGQGVFGAVMAACLILGGAGCATFDGVSERQEHAEGFREELSEKTASAVGSAASYDLEDCLRIGLENNLDIKVADIQKRIAKLDKRVAFSNFLPQLELDFQQVAWDRVPKSQLGGLFSVAMQDKEMRIASVKAQMPIFAPATWLAYSMRSRGEEIGDIVADYTRQMICLQITAMYFQCAAIKETGKSLDAQVAAAQSLESQVKAFREEGMVNESQLQEVELLLMARQSARDRNGRELRRATGDLLSAMGLSPLEDVPLRLAMPLKAPEGGLEEWVAQAMLKNPRLQIEDRKVAIQKDMVKLAITDFLPKLAGFATFEHTSNSYSVFANSLMGGLAGVMTLFNGFANINEYRIARQEQEAAFVEREQVCLSVMMEVVRAQLNLQNALEDRKLADKAFAVAQAKWKEVDAQWQEGLVSGPDKVAVTAERDSAEVNVINAQCQEQVIIAVLRNVLGATYKGEEVTRDAE